MIKKNDECLSNILEFKEAQCKLKYLTKTSVVEIEPGILILKHFNGNVSHDCSKLKFMQKGTFIVKF